VEERDADKQQGVSVSSSGLRVLESMALVRDVVWALELG
jgi:hypothetical protein